MAKHFTHGKVISPRDRAHIEQFGPDRYFNAASWTSDAIQRNLAVIMTNEHNGNNPALAANFDEGIRVVGIRGVWQAWLDAMREQYEYEQKHPGRCLYRDQLNEPA